MPWANVETRRNSYEAGSTYEHIFYEERATIGLFFEIWARGGSMTTASGGHRKRKTVERGLEDFCGARP